MPGVEEIAGDAAKLRAIAARPRRAQPIGRGGAGRTATELPLPQNVPLTWSPTENIVWQADVPGRGHSSPVTWGRRVFVTTADDENQVQSILAYDRDTGKQLWETVVNRGDFMPKSHRHNSHASATSACDGDRLFSVFIHDGGLWVTATNLDGKILWQTKAGDYDATLWLRILAGHLAIAGDCVGR